MFYPDIKLMAFSISCENRTPFTTGPKIYFWQYQTIGSNTVKTFISILTTSLHMNIWSTYRTSNRAISPQELTIYISIIIFSQKLIVYMIFL